MKHRHPYEDMRDTSLYHPLRRLVSVEREGDQPSLKRVTKAVLGKDVQEGYHCPVRVLPSGKTWVTYQVLTGSLWY